jgi:hypothetical protein
MRAWNAEVERQSREMDGGDRAHRRFVTNRWNFYEFHIPEEDMDHHQRQSSSFSGWRRRLHRG